jgi:hypothetical protein
MLVEGGATMQWQLRAVGICVYGLQHSGSANLQLAALLVGRTMRQG